MAHYCPSSSEDLPQIRAINSYYILHTSLTFMQTTPSLESYTSKWHDVIRRGLPYVVAVHQTQKIVDGLDLVLGYAYFSPFRRRLLSYTPTVELTLVQGGRVCHHSEELQQQIGAIGYHPSISDSATNIVRSVIAVMAVDPEGKDGGDALRGWYIQRGFGERGRMVEIGFNRGHWIDTIYLQYSVPK